MSTTKEDTIADAMAESQKALGALKDFENAPITTVQLPPGSFPVSGSLLGGPLPPNVAAGYAEDLLSGMSDPMAVMKSMLGPLTHAVAALEEKNFSEAEAADASAAEMWLSAAERAKKLGQSDMYEAAIGKAKSLLGMKKAPAKKKKT